MSIMVAVPCMDMTHTDFMIALTGLQHDGDVSFVYTKSSLVYDARNGLASQAIDRGFDRVLWLDSDMMFSPDLLQRLSKDIDAGMDMVCALYTTRRTPIKPAIFSEISVQLNDDGTAKPIAKTYHDYPKDSVFEVEACGFGGVMLKTSLLKEVKDKYGLPFSPILGFGEDISFCMRVKELGKKVYCDSRVKMGHIGTRVFSEADL